MQREPIELNGTQCDAARGFHVKAATEHHGKTVGRAGHATKRSRTVEATSQEMHERREGLVVAVRKHRTEGVSVVVEADSGLGGVGAAEIGSYAEPIVQVAGNCAVPAIRVGAAIKAGVLIAAEDLCLRSGVHPFLGERRQREYRQQECQTDKFTHLLYLL